MGRIQWGDRFHPPAPVLREKKLWLMKLTVVFIFSFVSGLRHYQGGRLQTQIVLVPLTGPQAPLMCWMSRPLRKLAGGLTSLLFLGQLGPDHLVEQFLSEGGSCSSGGIWQCLETFRVLTPWGWGMLWASSGQRPGLLAKHPLVCPLPPQKICFPTQDGSSVEVEKPWLSVWCEYVCMCTSVFAVLHLGKEMYTCGPQWSLGVLCSSVSQSWCWLMETLRFKQAHD